MSRFVLTKKYKKREVNVGYLGDLDTINNRKTTFDFKLTLEGDDGPFEINVSKGESKSFGFDGFYINRVYRDKEEFDEKSYSSSEKLIENIKEFEKSLTFDYIEEHGFVCLQVLAKPVGPMVPKYDKPFVVHETCKVNWLGETTDGKTADEIIHKMIKPFVCYDDEEEAYLLPWSYDMVDKNGGKLEVHYDQKVYDKHSKEGSDEVVYTYKKKVKLSFDIETMSYSRKKIIAHERDYQIEYVPKITRISGDDTISGKRKHC